MKELSANRMESRREAEITTLDGYGYTDRKAQGELIYTPQQPESAAFYITSGYIRLVNREKGTMKVVGPDEFFGDRSLFHSENIFAEALSAVELVKIDESAFRNLLQHETKLAMEIITSLSKHSIFLSKKQTLLSETKELINHVKKGNSFMRKLPKWKNKDECTAC